MNIFVSVDSTEGANRNKRMVSAPPPENAGHFTAFVSVDLAEDEDVEWHWSYSAEKGAFVTGYTVRKKAGDSGAT